MNKILYCHCAHAEIVAAATKRHLLHSLCASGAGFDALPDLCCSAAGKDPSLDGYSMVAACYPRAVRWLFERAGASLNGAAVFNLREGNEEKIAAALLALPPTGPTTSRPPDSRRTTSRTIASAKADGCSRALQVILRDSCGREPDGLAALIAAILERGFRVSLKPQHMEPDPAAPGPLLLLGTFPEDGPAPPKPQRNEAAGGLAEVLSRDASRLDDTAVLSLVDATCAEIGAERPDSWIPWYPVIDYERCADCQQCMSFCLFGVYALSESGAVEVKNPAQCKTNCPACARICPHVAIVFPKYKAGPLSGGEVTEENKEPAGVDVSALLGGDLRSALRARSFLDLTSDRREGGAPTGKPPCACTSGLAKMLDVPLETLRSLSRPENREKIPGLSKGGPTEERRD